jgi:PAS domain S-box-containing protein
VSTTNDKSAFDLAAELRELRLVEAFLDHSGEAFFAIRAGDGRVVYVNAAAERMYGYTQTELLSMTVDQVSAAYDGVDMAERMREYRERGRVVFETRHRAKDGRELPVEVALSYVRGEHGDHTVGVVRSLQERRHMAAALEMAEQRCVGLAGRQRQHLFFRPLRVHARFCCQPQHGAAQRMDPSGSPRRPRRADGRG